MDPHNDFDKHDRRSDDDTASAVLDGVTVAGARAFWKAQDMLNAIQAIATEAMVAMSDPHRTAEEYRASLASCCQAALDAIQAARPMVPSAEGPAIAKAEAR